MKGKRAKERKTEKDRHERERKREKEREEKSKRDKKEREGEMTREAAAAPKLSKLNVAIEVAEIIGRQDDARAMHIASSVDQVQRTILAFNAVYGEALPLVSMGGRNVVFENKIWQYLLEVDSAVRALRGYDVGTQSSDKAFKEQIAQAKAELDKARIGFACCCISHGISWCR